MTLIKKNIAANFTGSIWQALMGLVFIPLYIKFMGVESYGLIGIFATLQAIFIILDMGIGATLTREMARLSVLPGKEQEMRNLVRSLEVIYWCVAVFIGMAIMTISSFIAHHWVKAGQLSPQTIEQALRIMGFAMALQWPASFYSGGLMGLQRQVLLNVINIGMSTLRGAGAVLILWLISPTIQAFFFMADYYQCHKHLPPSLLSLAQAPAHRSKGIFSKATPWRYLAVCCRDERRFLF